MTMTAVTTFTVQLIMMMMVADDVDDDLNDALSVTYSLVRELFQSRSSRRLTASSARTVRLCCAKSSTTRTAPNDLSPFHRTSAVAPSLDATSALTNHVVLH